MKVAPGTPAILWGTTAHKSFGTPYYSPLKKVCGGTNVPLPGGGLGSLERTAKGLESILEGLRDTDGRLKLIGHSQGGLIAVLHAAKYADTEVLTLDAPHHGAPLCHLMKAYPKMVRNQFRALQDMCPGSEFMLEYQSVLSSLGSSLVSFATTHDKIVPHRSSYVCGAQNVLVVSSYDEYLKYSRYYGDTVELRIVPKTKMGHITSVISRQCIDFARDFVGQEHLKLVSA